VPGGERTGQRVEGDDPPGGERREPHAGEEPLPLGLVPTDRRDHVVRPRLGGVGGGRAEEGGTGTPAPVIAVDDERVHGDLRVAEDQRERVDAQDRQAHGDLAAGTPGRGIRARQDGEDDAMTGVLEQPAETRRRRVQAGVAGQDVLGVGVGAVLADQREDGGQVLGTRRARRDAGPRNGS
jgi:hypothetical protein